MLEPTPLEHARAVKLRLRAASEKATEARKNWVSARTQCIDANYWTSTTMRDVVSDLTMDMWAAEHALAAVAKEWRQCLAARATMPVTERWNLAGVERWACAVPRVGEVWASSCVTHQGLRWNVESVSDGVAVFRDMKNPEHSCHVRFSQLVYGWSREAKP